jgi:hypothetical protein
MKVRFRARCPKPPSAPNSVGRAHLFIFKLPLPPLWFSPLALLAHRSAACPVHPSSGHLNTMPNCLDAPLGSARLPQAAAARLGTAPSRLQLPPQATSARLNVALGRLRPSRRYRCRPTPRQPPRPRRLPSHRGGVFFDLNLSECG